ncbi:uncharacterized protein HLK63_D00011 [Nakaseomyces glabratus]|nr:uncharacterized protein GW608_D00011 [Nakaseomyces glabratus]UCS24616.1 uncharacterized protein HLK63_D00011 [Nakaseomyces glabratus]UCS29846.1 uncharacterized protein HLK64_D00011 [Nakaseomyces glabratus]UCS35075.1 uncharacterized protein HLK62_D00011 [Nakaseomyces glabratus]
MRFRNILLLAASTVFYCTSVLAKTYENQEIVLDSVTLGLTTYEDDELMVLKNAKVTLNDFTTIKLPEGISLSGNSVLTITAPSGDGTPYSIVINGKVSIDDESQFIFDGSSLSYKADVQDFSAFTFDINTGADGVFISKNSLMRIKLPKTTGTGLGTSINFNPSIHIGGTYKAPNNSPLAILGKLEVLKSESKVDGYFDDRLWRVDLGPDHIDENGVFTIQNDLSGNIHCQAYIGVYADIFKGTENVLIHAIGYQGYSVVSPITIDLGEGPVFDASVVLNYILLPEGQDGFKFLNLNYLEYGNSALFQLGFIYFFDGNSNDVIATAENNVIEVKNLKSQKSISITGDHNYNITTHYNEGNNDARKGYFSFHQYENEIVIFLQPIPSENPDYTTTIDKGNGDFETDLVSHITTKDSDGKPTTITTTIPLFGPAPPAETKTVDLGNEVTEYLVISYWTTTNEFGGLITTSSTRTYSPPPVTVTATTAADYVESDWISFFITTDEKGDIVTSSTLFNATRDYNLPEAPHTSFGPAPPAETKTVDLGNEVTEYLVISYWTTTNEFGGLITTSSTRTYSPPPVTVTATTAADYVESDWISFFITTDEKGDIVTSSTLFNATRDYNLPEAPHTSFGPAPPAETKTVDLGNEVTEYLVISYWTTTNEFSGLITTSSTRTYSPPPVTVTATTAADYVESDWISFFITTDEKGDIVTSSTLFNATRDYNLPEAPHTSFGPAPPAETKTVDLGNEVTEYLVISYWTTTNEFGGLITTSSTRTYSPPPVTVTATTAADYVESDWISFFITTNDKGEIITDSTLFNATREYIDAEAPHLSSSMEDVIPGEADYTTTIISNGRTITEVVSHVTTTDSDGKTITYITTLASYDQVDEGVFTSPAPYSQPPVVTTTVTEDDGSSKTVVISYSPTEGEDGVTRTGTTTISTITPSGEADYTTTIDKGNGDFETDLVSHITTKDSDGKPTTITTTIPLKPSDAGEADYTTTITSDGHTITEVVSHITTTNSDGNTVTYTTTMASFDQVDDGVYTSAPPYSQPPVVTTTVTEDDGSSKTIVISYSPSEGEDGVTRTGTTTISTITASGEADYTTTIDKGNGDFETDLVSHITTKDSDGKPTTITTTIPLKPSDAGEADYTTTIDKGNGDFETDLVSHITTKDSDGKPTTIVTTIPLTKPSGEADYTTTIDKGNGDFETDLVSHITTKDSDGKPTTITTTIPLKPSDAGEADYTTTITSDGHTITEVVSHITTTESDGNTVTYTTTMASFDQVDDGVYTSAPPYSQPPVVTTTVTEDDGSSKTVVISYSPSEGEDGVTRTGTTTVSTITPGEADYTTTIDKGNGEFETDLVSHITTKDSDGKPTTIITTVTLTEEPDYTSVFVSDGHTITAVVSHVTTTNDIGQTVTTTVTVMSYDQVGEGVYTSAPAYSQPPVTTITVSADTATATVVISYFPSIGDDGVTRTGTTTVSTVSVGGEADYTTTVDRGNGSIETDVISHITTTDSNGNPTTVTTTITNAPAPSNSKANVRSDYTTTVVSNGHTFTGVVSHSTGTDEHGHTIVSTVTQTVGGQSHGSTVSSATPVSTVSGAGSNAPGTAGVGGIVNSQKPQSGNVAGQGSGNEKPTQAAGTAGGSGSGSGSGSVHQSAGNNVPSGSPSVQSAKGTASPVSGIHSSQTPHSVPSQAQTQGQAQAQSSRQQAATTALLPSGSSVDNFGSGFSSTQTASVLQGKGASIKVTSISILFSIIAVIVVGMI